MEVREKFGDGGKCSIFVIFFLKFVKPALQSSAQHSTLNKMLPHNRSKKKNSFSTLQTLRKEKPKVNAIFCRKNVKSLPH